MKMFQNFTEKERAILEARARRMAELGSNDGNQDMVTALGVTVGTEHYAIPIEQLTAVHEAVNIISIPCVPPHIGGIANIRGHIIPVLLLNVLLDASGASSSKVALIVTEHKEMSVALQVDAIGDVVTFFRHAVAPLPAKTESDQVANYLEGFVPDSDAALLSITAILDDPSIIVSEMVS